MIKFNEKYNPDNFLEFLRDFLPKDFLEKEEDIIIDKNRYKEITDAKVLGYCKSLDLYVLEMDHARENDPRITIATDAFKILADHWIHRSLIIFRNKESSNYRFSYLTISLDVNEKNRVTKKYSNARRYSFYLGANAKIKTPELQLIKKGRIQNVEDLQGRFSLEVVNNQFYLEVARYFDELVAGLNLPSTAQDNINIKKSFVVRLIGRLMFCWFLKQKKSESGQLIPDEILSSNAVTRDYYHSIIEPLFFEVLNTSINAREIRSELFDKVPYLNGGLFNPQAEDYYELDRGTFFSKFINTLKIDDNWFKGFFELLETYNFTIDENTVFDQELSVDPEMLGRIFENLLAEINPETGNSEQKRTGSFYTPRQIVEYMIDQSLTEYFKNKTDIDQNKLSALVSYDLNDDEDYPLSDSDKVKIVDTISSLKILDPACGSGAFPIGALQKIVYILQVTDPDCKLWLDQKLKGIPDLYKQKIINEIQSNPFDYIRKFDVIKNSIFGVDIQPIAVDISRLRCFLTLVVESEIDDNKTNRGIEPLPNLDFKFVCANTLIGLPKSQSNSLFDDHSGIAELASIMSEYFSCNSQRKSEIRLRFTNTQKEMLNKSLSTFGKNMGELTQKLTTWDPFGNNSNSWFDPEWMFGIEDKFDIAIGNPPYTTLALGKKQSYFTGDYLKLLESLFAEVKEYKNNTFSYFIKRAYDLGKEDSGIISYIVPNVLLFNKSFSKVRKFMLDNSSIIYILDIKGKVFESAEIGGNCVFIANKNRASKTSKVLTMLDMNNIINPQYEIIEQKRFNISPDYKFYIDSKSYNIFEKIKTNATPLHKICNFYNGIKTGNNKRFLKENWENNLDELVIRGRDVQKYYIGELSTYVHFDKSQLWSNYNEDLLRKSPKILVRQTGDSIIAAIDDLGRLHMDTTHGLFDININIYYLMGLLNSKVIDYWHKTYTSEKGRTFAEVKIANIKEIPIKLSEDEDIIHLIKLILDIKQKNKEADTRDIESKIDALVYKIYNLTDDDIKIIEDSYK